jgi:hypothetical protein
MWYADLAGDRALVNKFSGPLSKFDHLTCPVYLVFAKKFHADASQSHPPASQP